MTTSIETAPPATGDTRQTVWIKMVISLTSVLLVGVGIYAFYQHRVSDQSSLAAEVFFQANEAYDKEITALLAASNVKQLNELKGPIKDIEAKFAKSLAGYKTVLAEHSKSREAFLAAQKVAWLYSNLENKDTGMRWYEKAIELANLPVERASAMISEGYVLIDMKNYDAAATLFERAFEIADTDYQKGTSLLGAAHAQKAKGDLVKAKEALEKISKLPTSVPQAKVAEALIVEWK